MAAVELLLANVRPVAVAVLERDTTAVVDVLAPTGRAGAVLERDAPGAIPSPPRTLTGGLAALDRDVVEGMAGGPPSSFAGALEQDLAAVAVTTPGPSIAAAPVLERDLPFASVEASVLAGRAAALEQDVPRIVGSVSVVLPLEPSVLERDVVSAVATAPALTTGAALERDVLALGTITQPPAVLGSLERDRPRAFAVVPYAVAAVLERDVVTVRVVRRVVQGGSVLDVARGGRVQARGARGGRVGAVARGGRADAVASPQGAAGPARVPAGGRARGGGT